MLTVTSQVICDVKAVAIDLVVCSGGDRGSELLFELLRDKGRMEQMGVLCGANRVFTCRVGTGRTVAGSRLYGPLCDLQVMEVLCGKQAWALQIFFVFIL